MSHISLTHRAAPTFAQTLADTLAQPVANAVANPVASALAEGLADPAAGNREMPSGAARVLPTVLPDPMADEAVAFAAIRAAGQRRAVFSRADVAGQIAAHLPTTGLTASQVVAEVERLTTVAVGLEETVGVGDHPHGVTPRMSDARYATLEVLNAEGRILALADRGRRGGYGQIPLTELMPHAKTLGLDGGQYKAVLELAGNGDFLTVLTAPAGAGKTRTLGATSAAWEQAGYRVVGLAPSARAAAELADATGGNADTLAKWLHTQDRLSQIPAGAPERAWASLDDRTVLIIDEASMASTLDLDRLITLAAGKAAKVVLVGDPAQIGVINGPGGMLSALAQSGHVSSLNRIHRFTHEWERSASLALRQGDPVVLPTYQTQGRLHACPDSDTALDGVFAHWTQARAEGLDALMLARTRQDVDALNTRAREAAVAAGEVSGPATAAGEREWQAGDVLRTRRNNRQLVLGDTHVRNGDRFLVLGPGPSGTGTAGEPGVIVEDLNGRGRVVLPAEYLEKHCEYGWASTIDSAQGATTDIGIVLVRPGMDREHLYVAMTRGRHANHAYLTPDPALDDEHDHGGHQRPTVGQGRAEVGGATGATGPALEQGLRVLETALATSGAQDAAHTALAQARVQAGKTTRRAQHDRAQAADRERAEARELARQELPEHQAAREQLKELQTERGRLGQEQTHRGWQLPGLAAELDRTPRRAIRRRRDLTDRLTHMHEAHSSTDRELAGLDTQISTLGQQVRGFERDREDRIQAQQRTRPTPSSSPTSPMTSSGDPLGYLQSSRRTRMASRARQLAQPPSRPSPEVVYRAPDRGGPSRGR